MPLNLNKKKESGLTYNEKKEFNKLEKEIANLEKKKEKIQQEFLENLTSDEIAKKSISLKEVEDSIEIKTERYFELGSKEA
ncbi:ABC transporter C-terminal domain-containing protein [Gillisia marina]|uniref:ABC transporter C-terminal domain-containing protein n=1 Tax=Gillisia marina TaxID=1167637 RepID=UPI0002F79C1D